MTTTLTQPTSQTPRLKRAFDGPGRSREPGLPAGKSVNNVLGSWMHHIPSHVGVREMRAAGHALDLSLTALRQARMALMAPNPDIQGALAKLDAAFELMGAPPEF